MLPSTSSCSRSKRILTLALNKDLQKKIESFKIPKCRKASNSDSDPEYFPDNASESSDKTGDTPQKKLKLQSTPGISKKVCILQNIVLRSPYHNNTKNEQNSLDQQNTNNNKQTAYNLENTNNIQQTPTTYQDTFTSLNDYISKTILEPIITHAVDLAEENLYKKKDGTLRKRKKYSESKIERKKQKHNKYLKDHYVQKICKCSLKCLNQIKYERQKSINQQFWKMSKNEQNMFVSSCIKKSLKKRNTAKENEHRRKFTYTYYLKNEQGESLKVCKVFLLGTLGFKKENDRILKNVRNEDVALLKPQSDKRGHASSKKIDRTTIIDHINSFGPRIAHYRREHAPDRKYLPSDISITYMYKDFKNKYGDNFSYELYRTVVADLNISFANLGHEECWTCEEYRIHKSFENHDGNENNSTCDVCATYSAHKIKATEAREEYKIDAKKPRSSEEIIVSADLQKVRFNMINIKIAINNIIYFVLGYHASAIRHF